MAERSSTAPYAAITSSARTAVRTRRAARRAWCTSVSPAWRAVAGGPPPGASRQPPLGREQQQRADEPAAIGVALGLRDARLPASGHLARLTAPPDRPTRE